MELIGYSDGISKKIVELALKNKKIPASLHFNKPNPEIDFENSPFFVNTELRDWEVPEGMPRRAGVSSFGIGGTNAHVILEEAPILPEPKPSESSRPLHVLPLSAKTEKALEELKKAGDDEAVFKHAGTIMIKSNKKDLLEELEEQVELAKTKASLLAKQEERLKVTLQEQETKIQEMMKGPSTNTKPSK